MNEVAQVVSVLAVCLGCGTVAWLTKQKIIRSLERSAVPNNPPMEADALPPWLETDSDWEFILAAENDRIEKSDRIELTKSQEPTDCRALYPWAQSRAEAQAYHASPYTEDRTPPKQRKQRNTTRKRRANIGRA